MKDYDVGNVVEYRDFMGRHRRARVTLRHRVLKNGQPGFDATLVTNDGPEPVGTKVWGYDDQIERVLSGEP